MECTRRIIEWIERHRLIRKGEKVLAALSGGPDSMAMTEILREISKGMGFTLGAAHLNHGIRRESDSERDLVARYCREAGLELVEHSVDVPAKAGETGKGLEEAAREARYSFLRRAAKESGAAKVALGHNREDQAETVLHHVIRGSGVRGLAGIPVRRDIFIRPVLCCGREELLSFLKERGIPYSIDRSNLDNSFTRNRIRNVLMPLLRSEFNPAIDDALVRLAENAAESVESAFSTAGRALARARSEGQTVDISLSDLEELGDFEIYLLIDTILKDRFGVFQDIDKCHFDSVKALVRSGHSGRSIELPHGIRVGLEQLSLRISSEHGEGKCEEGFESIVLQAEGRYELPSAGITVRIESVALEGRAIPVTTDTEAYLESLTFPVTIRPRRPGDRMSPFGMKGTKKLSDIMIDAKIPLHERGSLPVFEDGEGIVWVPGVAADERTRIRGRGKKCVRILIERHG